MQLNKVLKKKILVDRAFTIVLICAMIIYLVPIISIIYETVSRGLPALNLDFFTKPIPTAGEEGGGIANAIQGTVISIALASLIGIPVGILSGIFLSEYRELKITSFIRFINEVFHGIPSIIIGLFSFVLISKRIGFSVLAASFSLALIMIPIVTIVTQESLKMVPATIREAAFSLGIPKWKTTIFIVLRGAWQGIVTGILLSIGRIIGESAPILVTMGFYRWWFSGLDRPVSNMALNIFIFAMSPFQNWVRLAWGTALVLLVLVLLLNIIPRLIMLRREVRYE
jgi:phosphate transport system permease protein